MPTKDTDPDWTETHGERGQHGGGGAQSSLKRCWDSEEDVPDPAKRPRLSTPPSSTFPAPAEAGVKAPVPVTPTTAAQLACARCSTPPAEQENLNTVPFCTSGFIASIVHSSLSDPSCPNPAVKQLQKQPSASDFRALARSSVMLPGTRGPIQRTILRSSVTLSMPNILTSSVRCRPSVRSVSRCQRVHSHCQSCQDL